MACPSGVSTSSAPTEADPVASAIAVAPAQVSPVVRRSTRPSTTAMSVSGADSTSTGVVDASDSVVGDVRQPVSR